MGTKVHKFVKGKESVEEEVQADYVEFGSREHAERVLGLRPATKEDKHQVGGWAFVDELQFGALARDEYIDAMLKSRVNELKAGPPPLPLNAKRMWQPAAGSL